MGRMPRDTRIHIYLDEPSLAALDHMRGLATRSAVIRDLLIRHCEANHPIIDDDEYVPQPYAGLSVVTDDHPDLATALQRALDPEEDQ